MHFDSNRHHPSSNNEPRFDDAISGIALVFVWMMFPAAFLPFRFHTHYLSLVMDACTRKIMGYEVSREMKSSDVVKALKMAIGARQTNLPLNHHSDRGLQYCSGDYQQVLAAQGILSSMTDGYDCYQNALAERVNGILKQEFLLNHCKSFEELKLLVKQSVSIYNHFRPHLRLGMKTPEDAHKKASSLWELA